jgi:ribosomal protein S18 acetylase RimI-like enzyme
MTAQQEPILWRCYNKNGLSIGTVLEPMLYFSRDPAGFNKIIIEADAIVASSFGTVLEGCDSTRDHLLGVNQLSLASLGGRILGFASSKLYQNHNLFYLHGVVVDPSLKGQGIGKALVKELLDGFSYGVDYFYDTKSRHVLHD